MGEGKREEEQDGKERKEEKRTNCVERKDMERAGGGTGGGRVPEEGP